MKHIIAPLLFFIISLTLNAEDSNNILILSIAKSGTHLAGKLVSLITGKIHKSPSTIERLKIRSSLTAVIHLNRKSHMFSHLHTAYSETTEALLKKMNIRTIFIYRDPRDQILSWIGHDQENIEQRVRQAILPDFEYIAAEKGVTNYY